MKESIYLCCLVLCCFSMIGGVEFEKNNYLNLKKCYDLQSMVSSSSKIYNQGAEFYCNGSKFEIRRIFTFYNNEIDSLYLMKSDFILAYSIDDIRKDSLFAKQIKIYPFQNISLDSSYLIDNTDSFFVRKQTNKQYLVQNTTKSNWFRLYIFK
jgi:hypothetical protein